MKVKAKAPVRIDFGGPWTDVSPYRDEYGGATLNAAITQYVEGEKNFEGNSNQSPIYISTPSGHFKYFIGEKEGTFISYGSGNIPTGSGLGTSAALNVVLLSLIKYTGEKLTFKRKTELAELAYRFEEDILSVIGGKQDQYAAAFGGINLFHFSGDEVDVEKVNLEQDIISELERRLVLCFSGESRLSSNIHRNVWSNYRDKKKGVREALHNMKDLATTMKCLLLEEKLDEFGALLSENWKNQKKLDKSITNQKIESLFEIAYSNGIIGGKACGAGGGGCLLFYTHEREKLENALQKEGTRIISFKFDFTGLTCES